VLSFVSSKSQIPPLLDAAADGEVTSLADEGLVVAARRGDMRAFERLYRRHNGRVMGLCLRMCRRRDMAEDCTQATFVRAWRNLQLFEGRSAFSTWLHRIAVNEVLGYLRNHGTRAESDSDAVEVATEAARPTRVEADVGEVMDVEGALETLPEGARHVVVLQAVYGYSHEEVADMLGIAVGTCKAQLHRARALLRERLGLAESAS
jgi:RNA polymerase sigma-70 factor (ECF subfamily)